MSITVFGVLFLTIAIIFFINNKEKMLLGMLMLSMCIQTTSVIILGDNGVGPQIFASIIFFAWIFLNSNIALTGNIVLKKKKGFWHFSSISIWVFFGYIIFTTYQVHNNANKSQNIFLYIWQLLIYIICYLSIPYISRRIDKKDVESILEVIITIVLAVGVIQFLTTTNILPRNILLNTLIYNTSGEEFAYNLSYYPRVFSTFMEPSYYSAFLVGSFYYLISRNVWNKKNLCLSIVTMAEIVLTFSSTAYGATVLTGIVYLSISKNKKALKYLIPLGIFAVIFLSITGVAQDILSDVIFNKMRSGSGITRTGWDTYAMKIYSSNKLFGVGYKMVRGSSLYTSVLGQLGIVGAVLYAVSFFPLILTGLRTTGAVSAALFLVGCIMAQIIALPDLDLCVFWLGMYLLRLMLAYEVSPPKIITEVKEE